MDAPDVLSALHKDFESTADVNRVFGEPVVIGDRTLIPVARVSAGFGGGMGRKTGTDGTAGGGGGGLEARPMGAIEVTKTGTKYVPVYDPGAVLSVAKAAVFGLFFGMMFRRRR
ncbi:MAG: hypothetical protein JST30_12350 [Armatimonadetes bacterium]|nr:hypothetical protein [Armatimonadota bacterium]